jgi:hypothetical protein
MKFWRTLVAEYAKLLKTRSWWLGYASNLAFLGIVLLPDYYLIRPHSHAAFWVAWFIALMVPSILSLYVEKYAKGRK